MQISEIRKKVNNTCYDIKEKLIHEDFFKMAEEKPDFTAVVWREKNGDIGRVSYRDIADKALRYSGLLLKSGVEQGDIVAVAIEKGAEYISAVMGILAAGAVFLPMSSSVPLERRKYICNKAQVKYAVSEERELDFFTSIGVKGVTSTEAKQVEPVKTLVENSIQEDAYIIFTSGTTGNPKGVEIQHYAANNTIMDINERFYVSSDDSIFAVSEIDFDLSVYDIFGMLSVGGTVVISDKSMKKEASLWKEIMKKEKVTVWNSVPMLLEMLLCADVDNEVVKNLRLIMVSGDWVYPSLIEKIREKNKEVRIIALGGATEASIWSNYYEIGEVIESSWKSVPYGTPLHNQRFRIVNENGEDCADNEEGEIWIGGKGLARGYINMPELTEERFVNNAGERWYRTGDKGRYWTDGNIEFLGRLDNQVKFGGYRVELDEITRKLNRHEKVGNAYTVMVQKNTKQYLASIVAEKNQGKKCTPQKIGEDNDNSNNIVKYQTIVVDRIIISILGLEDKLNEEITEKEIFKSLGFDEGSRNIFNYWMNILKQNGCITIENGYVSKGKKFSERVALGKDELSNAFDSKMEFISDILRGKRMANEMFEDEFLSPEKMANNEQGLIKGVNRIAELLNERYERDEMNIQIGILGARTGDIAKVLMDKLSEIDADFTLMDSSEYFISQAKNNLEDYECGYKIVKDYVPEDIRNTFDVVIAVNELHTHADLKHGVFLVKDLMKHTGTAYVVELKELPPLSKVTAAIIENAFEKYTIENRPQVNNPIVSAEKMTEIMAESGLRSIKWSDIEESLFVLIEATGKNSDVLLSANALKYYLGQQMPEYMIPEKIIFVNSIPLNKNGKADRERIFEIVADTDDFKELIPPKTETEKKIAELWKKILCVEEVGINQSFFKAGGDSLLATHLLTTVKKDFNIELSLKEMYNDPTLEAIAAFIDERLAEIDDEEQEFGEI